MLQSVEYLHHNEELCIKIIFKLICFYEGNCKGMIHKLFSIHYIASHSK